MSDLISRQDAIDAVNKRLQDPADFGNIEYRSGLYESKDIIEALPSTDRPKGEWRYDAVKGLDAFTKAFCRDYSVTDDLEFRCKQCDFEMPDGRCLVKVMAHEICPEYKDFGSMGDH